MVDGFGFDGPRCWLSFAAHPICDGCRNVDRRFRSHLRLLSSLRSSPPIPDGTAPAVASGRRPRRHLRLCRHRRRRLRRHRHRRRRRRRRQFDCFS